MSGANIHSKAAAPTELAVFLEERRVGTLAWTTGGTAAFQYSPEWISSGFSISPLSLPLDGEVRVAKPEPLEGLHGVFSDSLPDGWGRLLVDRMLARHGFNPAATMPLEHLAIVGSSGMGALRYEPERNLASESPTFANLDDVLNAARQMGIPARKARSLATDIRAACQPLVEQFGGEAAI